MRPRPVGCIEPGRGIFRAACLEKWDGGSMFEEPMKALFQGAAPLVDISLGPCAEGGLSLGRIRPRTRCLPPTGALR